MALGMALGFEYIGVKVVVSISVRVVTVSYTKSLTVVVYVGVIITITAFEGTTFAADEVEFSVCVMVVADGLVIRSVVTTVAWKVKVSPVAVYPSKSEHQPLQLFEDMIDLAALMGLLGVGKLGTLIEEVVLVTEPLGVRDLGIGPEDFVLAAELAPLVIVLDLKVLKDELKLGVGDGGALEGIIGIRGKPKELVKSIDAAVGVAFEDRSELEEAPYTVGACGNE